MSQEQKYPTRRYYHCKPYARRRSINGNLALTYLRNNRPVQIVLFLIEGRPYGLPLEMVIQVLPMVEVSPLPSSPEVLRGVINYHGEILPVMDLRVRLALPVRAPELTDRLIIVNTARRKLALAADAVTGVREVPPEMLHDLTALAADLRQVAGIVTLEDGLVVIQDVEALLSAEEEEQLCRSLREAGQ